LRSCWEALVPKEFVPPWSRDVAMEILSEEGTGVFREKILKE